MPALSRWTWVPTSAAAAVTLVLLSVLGGCGSTPDRAGRSDAGADRRAQPPPLPSPTARKGIWGPASAAAFARYRDLGAAIYETALNWHDVAVARPRDPRSPKDPAYRWPPALDQAIRLARASRMRVLVELTGAPSWANGGHDWNWAPQDPRDFARFASAAARRYPSVHLWAIWGEPSRAANFMPLHPERRDAPGDAPAPMAAAQLEAPRRYARILDAAYGALKAASPGNMVIGGDTFSTGDISPYNWIRALCLPDGRPPRMDLYGHNPFTLRTPSTHGSPLGEGHADFSNLWELEGWLDRFLSGRRAGPRRLPLFLLEFTIPTDHQNREFNFWVDRPVQTRWLAAALRIVSASPRIYGMGWLSLYDDPPQPDGLESDKGLLTYDGRPKPGYQAYRRAPGRTRGRR
jgi:hypothetical protein